MYKKVLSFLLVFIFIFSSFAMADSGKEKIDYLMEKNIVIGKDDGKLHLDDSLTRAEATKLLVHSLKLDSLSKTYLGQDPKFPDVDSDHWAAGYILLATSHRMDILGGEKSIIRGFPDGNFYPEKNVTLSEFLAMVLRISKPNLNESGIKWPDFYIEEGEADGLLDGVDFENPEEILNREKAFIILYNGLMNVEDRKVVTPRENFPIIEESEKEEKVLEEKNKKLGRDSGYVVEIGNLETLTTTEEEIEYYSVTIGDKNGRNYRNHRNYNVSATEKDFFSKDPIDRKISFDVVERFEDTKFIYNIRFLKDERIINFERKVRRFKNPEDIKLEDKEILEELLDEFKSFSEFDKNYMDYEVLVKISDLKAKFFSL